MATIAIVGDGPGGLSAALFLAKADHDVTVYGLDETAMNHAYLYNYLGIDEIDGTEFQERARAQVAGFGASLVAERVTEVAATTTGITVSTDNGGGDFDYLVLNEGRKAPLAQAVGAGDPDGNGIDVDRNGRSAIDRVYVIGRSVRPTRSQAIISAGDGAAAALDILAREAGSDVQDWDTPPKD